MILAALLSSATGFVLTAFHRRSKVSGEAAIKYYLLGALTNGAMLYGAALLFGLGASTTFSGLQVGLAFGSRWLGARDRPDVAEGVPAPAAAFLTVAAKVGALARLMGLLLEMEIAWRPLVAVLAAATMTLGNLAALWQDDVRRFPGWSGVSRTGYGLMALVALGRSDLAVPSLLFFFVAYALANTATRGMVRLAGGAGGRQHGRLGSLPCPV